MKNHCPLHSARGGRRDYKGGCAKSELNNGGHGATSQNRTLKNIRASNHDDFVLLSH